MPSASRRGWASRRLASCLAAEAPLDHVVLRVFRVVDRLVELVEVRQRLLHGALGQQLPDRIAIERVDGILLGIEERESLLELGRRNAVPAIESVSHRA